MAPVDISMLINILSLAGRIDLLIVFCDSSISLLFLKKYEGLKVRTGNSLSKVRYLGQYISSRLG